MKIRHNPVPYIIPGVLISACLYGVFTDADNRIGALLFALIIIALCAIHYFTRSLSFTENSVNGKTGFIKRQSLTSPLSKIQYCDYSSFLCFNTIKINAITGTYEFKNMSNAKGFVDVLNEKLK